MKINELLSAQQEIDEGFGDFVGRAAGHAVGAVGKAGRGLSGAWQDAKAGYAAAKSSWDPKDETDPTAAPTAAPGAAAPAPQSGSAPGRPYVAPAPAAARTAPGAGTTAPAPSAGGNMDDIIKMIDTLDPASKQTLAGELEKNIAATPKPEEPAAPTAAEPTTAPTAAAPTTAPTAAAKPAAAGVPKGFTVPGAVTPTNVKFSGLAKPGAKPTPTQAELDADQASMATGSNESKVFRSNFLGIDI